MEEFIAHIHPFVVHFAVAFTLSSILFEFLFLLLKKEHFAKTAFTLAIVAVPFMLLALLTGSFSEEYYETSREIPLLETHETFGYIAAYAVTGLVLLRILLVVKKRYNATLRVVYLVLMLAIGACTFYTAEEGGQIRHGDNPLTPHQSVKQTSNSGSD